MWICHATHSWRVYGKQSALRATLDWNGWRLTLAFQVPKGAGKPRTVVSTYVWLSQPVDIPAKKGHRETEL